MIVELSKSELELLYTILTRASCMLPILNIIDENPDHYANFVGAKLKIETAIAAPNVP